MDALVDAWAQGVIDLMVITFALTTVFWGGVALIAWSYIERHWEIKIK